MQPPCPKCGGKGQSIQILATGEIQRKCADCSEPLSAPMAVANAKLAPWAEQAPEPAPAAVVPPTKAQPRLTQRQIVSEARKERTATRKLVRQLQKQIKAEEKHLAELDRLLDAADGKTKTSGNVTPIRKQANGSSDRNNR